MNYELEEFIYSLDVMSSVYDKVMTNQPIQLIPIFSIRIKMSWNIGDKRNLFHKLKSNWDPIMLYLYFRKLLP